MYIIIGIIVALLILGVTLRKNLVTWFRSEANEIIENNTDHVKVAKLKIKDAEKNLDDLAEQAANVYAEQQKQSRRLEELKQASQAHLAKAKKYKDNGDAENAKVELTAKASVDRNIEAVEENIERLEVALKLLKTRARKLKTLIDIKKTQVTSISSRASVNKVLKAVSGSDVKLDTNIQIADEKISFEEDKLQYLTGQEDPESFTEEVDKEFEKL